MLIHLAALLFSLSVYADGPSKPVVDGNTRMSMWMQDHYNYALDWILANTVGARTVLNGDSDERGKPGAIIAAPSVVYDHQRGETQNYNDWRWKRDSAIIQRFTVRMMIDGPLQKLPLSSQVEILKNGVYFSEHEQLIHQNENGFELGHAKVTLRGERNPHAWGYPQNDGPPLENLALNEILKFMDLNEVYNPELRKTVLRVFARNVDYILKNYNQPAVEAWEEVKAESHFSILLEKRKALVIARQFLKQLGTHDRQDFKFNSDQVEFAIRDIESMIQNNHRSQERGHVLSHYNLINDGSLVRNKVSQLDTQVLMSSLRTNKFWDQDENLYFAPNDPWMRATFNRLREAFLHRYGVNKNGIDIYTGEKIRGVAFGRYPEDHQHFGGPPWFITTFAAVQYLMWDAMYMSHRKHVVISERDRDYFLALNTGLSQADLGAGRTEPLVIPECDPRFDQIRNGLVKFAKEIYFRATIHAGDGRHLTEVFDADDGHMFGIEGLVWTYVESVTTIRMFWRAQNEFGIDLKLAPPAVKRSCSVIFL